MDKGGGRFPPGGIDYTKITSIPWHYHQFRGAAPPSVIPQQRNPTILDHSGTATYSPSPFVHRSAIPESLSSYFASPHHIGNTVFNRPLYSTTTTTTIISPFGVATQLKDLTPTSRLGTTPLTHRTIQLSAPAPPNFVTLRDWHPVPAPPVSPPPLPTHGWTPQKAFSPPPPPEEGGRKLAESLSSTSSFSSHNFESDDSADDEDNNQPSGKQAFCGAWVPLTGGDANTDDDDEEALFLDPATQLYLKRTYWIAKYGEIPRDTLREPEKPADWDEPGRWPSRESFTPVSLLDGAPPTDKTSFAEMVAAQLALNRGGPSPQSELENQSSASSVFPGVSPFKSEILSSSVLPAPEPSGPVSLAMIDELLDDGSQSVSDCRPAIEESSPVLTEEDIQQAVENTQRRRGLAAKIDVMESELKILETAEGVSGTRRASSPSSSSRVSESRSFSHERYNLKRAYEDEIARLRAEADEARRKAADEQARREEDRLKQLAELEEFAARAKLSLSRETDDDRDLRRKQEDQLKEMARKTEEMQLLLDRMSAATELSAKNFIPFDRHGITAIQLHLAKIGDFVPQIATRDLSGQVTLYAVVKLGSFDLHSKLAMDLVPEDLAKGSTEQISWNDDFNFPYLNERFLSITVRAKDLRTDAREYDILIGAARIDLELYILNRSISGQQILQLYDQGGAPAATLQLSVRVSSEVFTSAFLTTKSREMNPINCALAKSLQTAYLQPADAPIAFQMVSKTVSSDGDSQRQSSIESLEQALRNLDFRSMNFVSHSFTSVHVEVQSAKGLKLGHKTPDLRASVEVTLESPVQTLTTSVKSVQVQPTKRKRLFAFVQFNETCSFPFQSEKQITFKLLDNDNLDENGEPQELGSSKLNTQRLIMSGLPWFRRRLKMEKLGTGRRLATLEVSVKFSGDSLDPTPDPTSSAPITLDDLDGSTSNTSSRIGRSLSLPYGAERFASNSASSKDDKFKFCDEPVHCMPSSCKVTVEGVNDLRPLDATLAPYVRIKLGNLEAVTTRGEGSNYRWRLQNALNGDELARPCMPSRFECYTVADTASVPPGEKLVGVAMLPLTDVQGLPGHSYSGELRVTRRCV